MEVELEFFFHDNDIDTDDVFGLGFDQQRPGGRGGAFTSHTFNFAGSNSNKADNKERSQDPVIENDLYVSLEDILKSCKKKMKILRRVAQPDGSTRIRKKIRYFQSM